ncbi:MAG: ATP-binding protein [Saccharothrix sp.]|nr:ATP-binding protein [Saccharothrix sp.]
MLRSFRVGNHRSIRDEQELLLVPAYAKDRQAVPVAAVYGANASGKSNLLDGLKFLTDAVRDSFAKWPAEGGVPRRPFRLDPAARKRPSTFVVELLDDDVRYVYGFEVDDERVLSEWLYAYPEKRKRVIFERERDEVKFGSTVADLRITLDVLEGLLRSNALFLSLAARTKLGPLLPVHHWLTSKLAFRLALPAVDETEIVKLLLGESRVSRRFVDLVKVADFGVSAVGLSIEMTPEKLVELFGDLSRESWADSLPELALRLNVSELRLKLTHGDGEQAFHLGDESAGTRSWLALLPSVLGLLEDGGVLVIDEIDASLHPRLTAQLVALFRDARVNGGGAQLVFTTHDPSLLSPALGDDVLRRDEVWFVEKRDDGATDLYPLSDFHPRKDGENLARRYLGGSYGAVPNLLEGDFVEAFVGPGGADGAA